MLLYLKLNVTRVFSAISHRNSRTRINIDKIYLSKLKKYLTLLTVDHLTSVYKVPSHCTVTDLLTVERQNLDWEVRRRCELITTTRAEYHQHLRLILILIMTQIYKLNITSFKICRLQLLYKLFPHIIIWFLPKHLQVCSLSSS